MKIDQCPQYEKKAINIKEKYLKNKIIKY